MNASLILELPPDNNAITDEEIGIALCLGQHRYDLDQLRAAAQLLSSPRVDPARLCRLACTGTVRAGIAAYRRACR